MIQRWLWRVLGRRYPRLAVVTFLPLAFVVTLAGLGLLTLYLRMGAGEFWILVAAAEGVVLLQVLVTIRQCFGRLRAADPWLRDGRRPEDAPAAWEALAGLPLRSVTHRWLATLLTSIVPIAAFIVAFLELRWFSAPILAAGAAVVLSYGVLLRYFGLELLMQPVLEDVARTLPQGTELRARTVPARWRMLIALPAINVITGVVVSALSSDRRADLGDLGFDVLFAFGVSFTLSLGLSLLLARSILGPLRTLRKATEAVAAGDLTTRVPVIGTDETGRLGAAFNDMVAGLQERTALQSAFGSYVDPSLAQRVLDEGEVLAGQDEIVSVLFLDIRDFTAYSERAPASAVVRRLNQFFELVVPLLHAHGGHANKFVGDGLLAVFGAPVRMDDHADRAVRAGLEVVERVREVSEGRVRIGVGINSGSVVAGTIGGGGRLEYTVIGDTVNTAARVEQHTRDTGDDLLITEATLLRCAHLPEAFVPRGEARLKGRREPVKVFAPAAGPVVWSVDAGEPGLSNER